VDYGPSLSIFLPFSPNNSLSLSPTSKHTFTSTVLTNSQKTLVKKPLQKFSNSSKKKKKTNSSKSSRASLFSHNPKSPVKTSPPGYDHSLVKKKRVRLSGELFPHKRGSGNSLLSAFTPDEMELAIPMDTTPKPSLHLPTRPYYKGSRKGEKKTLATVSHVSSVVLENDDL
jgi:hypothetical protein